VHPECHILARSRRRRHVAWWVERGVYGVLRDGWVTLWRIGFTGVPQGCVRFPQNGRVGRPLLVLVEREAELLLQKGASRKLAGGTSEVVTDPEWSVLYPLLFAHLTQTVWEDGSTRVVSTLTIFADGGMVKALLKDREGGCCLWAASKTFTDVPGILEALLADPAAEWRVDRVVAGQKASRVKK